MITNNDVLRSKLTLTNDKLAYKETRNDIILVSQQWDMVLGLDENTPLESDKAFLAVNLTVQPVTYNEYRQAADTITGIDSRAAGTKHSYSSESGLYQALRS
jgi:hypothetical protein